MTNYIAVPLRVDALFLASDESITGRTVVEPTFDPTRLPYIDPVTRRDINSDTPYISAVGVSQPFQNRNLLLQPGVHLHWALPDALTRATHNEDTGQNEFPEVLNRWLVSRKLVSGSSEQMDQWIVESDCLVPAHKERDALNNGGVCYPLASSDNPYRFLGRAVKLSDWSADDSGSEYLDSLTAAGYGDPTFAGFYPNCRSVFGFHDAEISQVEFLNGAIYDVVGWYSDSLNDPLTKRISAFLADPPTPLDSESIQNLLRRSLSDSLGWRISADLHAQTRLICFGQISFAPNSGTTHKLEGRTSDPARVAVGNTASEAVATLMARNEHGSVRAGWEDQLESLSLAPDLEHRKLDVGAKFSEGRHTRGFQAVSAGTRWTIKQEIDLTLGQASEGSRGGAVKIPEAIGHLLSEVNMLQAEFDQATAEIQSSRRQLFSDWHQYMTATYPSESFELDEVDIDAIKHYIEDERIGSLKCQIISQGEIELRADANGRIIEATGGESASGAVGQRLAAVINKLLDAIVESNVAANLLYTSSALDWLTFINEFSKPAVAGLARHFWDHVPDKGRRAAAQLIGKEELTNNDKSVVVAVVNSVLQNAAYHRSLDLTNVDLDQATKDWLADPQNATGRPMDEVVRINRVLFEKSFPKQIPIANHTALVVRQAGASRYWQPREPVVMIEGNLAVPTERHGHGRRLTDESLIDCWEIDSQIDTADSVEKVTQLRADVLEHVSRMGTPQGSATIALNNWQEQPWHPIFLEWEVETFAPLKPDYNFHREYIQENYSLELQNPELIVSKQMDTQSAGTFVGRSLLSGHAKTQLLGTIEAYVDRKLVENYASSTNQRLDSDSKKRRDFVREKLADSSIMAWYLANEAGKPDKPSPDPSATFLAVHEELRNKNCLSQSLSGFNDALLMHRQVMQIPVEDPLGFEEYQSFTELVRRHTLGQTLVAPEPNRFSPIRCGAMKLLRLRLVDTFGQTRDVDFSSAVVGETMALPESLRFPVHETESERSLFAGLPPRLVQPSRLSFRWLAAEIGEVEMNDHPATSPICGWVVPNLLDLSLMVYSGRGDALGSIDVEAHWEPAPGRSPIYPHDVPNDFLRKMVVFLLNQGANYVGELIREIERVYEKIEPENFAQHQDLAMLMGQPIAVVRASLGIELLGAAASDQRWSEFEKGLQQDTRGFTQIRFPIRLGEHEQLNDGLIGYWVESDGGYAGDTFYSTAGNNKIGPVAEKLFQSVDDAPQTFTMLVDPRGFVHATCGILPTKAIRIPPEQFAKAVQRISVTFLTAPVLTNPSELRLPLPEEHGYQWAWISRNRSRWNTIPAAEIGKPMLNADFAAKTVIRDGWLQLSPQPSEDVVITSADALELIESRPFLGVGIRNTSTTIVTTIHAGSTAERMGLRVGDRLLELNRTTISNLQALRDLLGQHAVGDTISLRIQRDARTVVLGPAVLGSAAQTEP